MLILYLTSLSLVFSFYYNREMLKSTIIRSKSVRFSFQRSHLLLVPFSHSLLAAGKDDIHQHEIIYGLKLESDKYYVGKTSNLHNRFSEHNSNTRGSLWTAKYKPLNVIQKWDRLHNQHENFITYLMMSVYDYSNVRGGKFCKLDDLSDEEKRAVEEVLIKGYNIGCLVCKSRYHFTKDCSTELLASADLPTLITEAALLVNEEQVRAIKAPVSTPVRILAGAGSGKTKVLAHRIAYLTITQQNFTSDSVLATTFTGKAAAELRHRVATLNQASPPTNNNNNNNISINFFQTPNKYTPYYIGTFHYIALRLLLPYLSEAGLNPNFKILDQSAQNTILKQIMKEHKLDIKSTIKELGEFINNCKENCIRATAVTTHTFTLPQHSTVPIHDRPVYTNVYIIYEQICMNKSYLDFAEILLRAYELLCSNEAVLERYRVQFKHVLVDEVSLYVYV